jgi:hypothetical protein
MQDRLKISSRNLVTHQSELIDTVQSSHRDNTKFEQISTGVAQQTTVYIRGFLL